MLGVSQFTDIFHLTPPGGEALEAISASDQHGYATLVLAIFALILLVVTMAARGQQLGQVAAVAIAVCGVVALLIFLIGDLPEGQQRRHAQRPAAVVHRRRGETGRGLLARARRRPRADRLRRRPRHA